MWNKTLEGEKLMNLSSLMSEYTAQAITPLVFGNVKLTINEKAMIVSSIFDIVEKPFTQIIEIRFEDYIITVKTNEGDYSFSHMGQWAQCFYDELCEAYNKAVLRSMFISSKPILTAKCDYNYTEVAGQNLSRQSGFAPVHVYENCVVILPPNLSARRVPLCFVNGMDKGDYNLTLRLDSTSCQNVCESYSYSKLGYDTAPFELAVEKQIRALHEKTLAAVKNIDLSLTVSQALRLAKLMPEGAAAPIGQISAISPSFLAALEERICNTRAAQTYKVFKELSMPESIYIGFRKNELMPEDIEESEDEECADVSSSYLLWFIASSRNGQYATVEFAEADTASFVYRTAGNFDSFAKQLNRALEAISFKREVIRLTDKELHKAEYADYLMALNYTSALKFIRENFVGRIIHTNIEAWKRKLLELWSSE